MPKRKQLAEVRQLSSVRETVDKDTIDCLEALLDEARDGKIIGLAFAALYPGKRYLVDTAGECLKSPTYAAGMVLQLQNAISEKIGEW